MDMNRASIGWLGEDFAPVQIFPDVTGAAIGEIVAAVHHRSPTFDHLEGSLCPREHAACSRPIQPCRSSVWPRSSTVGSEPSGRPQRQHGSVGE